MKALIDISHFCHQTLSFKCFGSPLKIGSKNIGYWLDRQGDPQYFFDGNQTDQHGCKCKQDNSCETSFGNEFGCNCNARLPEWNIDEGTISGQKKLDLNNGDINCQTLFYS